MRRKKQDYANHRIQGRHSSTEEKITLFYSLKIQHREISFKALHVVGKVYSAREYI